MPELFWGKFYSYSWKDSEVFFNLTDLKSFPKLRKVLLDLGNFRIVTICLIKTGNDCGKRLSTKKMYLINGPEN